MAFSGSSRLTPQELDKLARTPALEPPPGVTSNLDNPRTIKRQQIIVCSLLISVAFCFTFIRAYVKTFVTRKYKWDDCTLLLGLIGAVLHTAACIWAAKKGTTGSHLWDVSVLQAASLQVLIPSYIESITTAPTMLLIKITFFIMYLEIFRLKHWLKICSITGIVVVIAFYGSMTIITLVVTTPRRHESWLECDLAPRHQITLKISVPQSAFGLAFDLYILALPILGVWKLQMPKKRKAGIILVFFTASLAALGSLLSMYFRVKLNQTQDLSWAVVGVNITTVLEMSIGIAVACMPATSRAFRHLSPLRKGHNWILLSSNWNNKIRAKLRSNSSGSPKATSEAHVPRKGQILNDSRPWQQLSECQEHHTAKPAPIFSPVTTRTVIRREGSERLEEDGIHLTYELQQSALYNNPSRSHSEESINTAMRRHSSLARDCYSLGS